MMDANAANSNTNNGSGDDLVIPHSLPTNNNNQQCVGVPGTDIDFEIVGLFSSSNGRFCCQHKICGEHLCVGDVLRLVKTVIEIDQRNEEAIKLVKIIDGSDGCTVGFIPRVQSRLPKVSRNINSFCVVQELYQSSNSVYKQKKGDKNHGMASAILLSCIPINE
jgi:hypothetical protein